MDEIYENPQRFSERIRQSWAWYVMLGIGLVVLEIIAIIYSVASTFASVMVFGLFLLIGGLLQATHAFRVRNAGEFFLYLLLAILYVVVGLLLMTHPIIGAVALTLIMGAFFSVGGLFRILSSVELHHHRNWGWLLLNGIITLILGILILTQWPVAAMWVIGFFVGIDLLFTGWSVASFGMMAHVLPRQAAQPS